VRIQNKYIDTNREIIPTVSDLSLTRTESDLLFRILIQKYFHGLPVNKYKIPITVKYLTTGPMILGEDTIKKLAFTHYQNQIPIRDYPIRMAIFNDQISTILRSDS